MEKTQQQSALKVSVQALDLAGTSRRAMRIRWSHGESGGPQELAAYDVNLLLENGRVVQLAQGLPASTHELVSAMEAPGRARIQVVGVRADARDLEQGLTSWMEPGALPEEQAVGEEALLLGAGAPRLTFVNPSTLGAGITSVTIEGERLPVAFGYAITNLSGQVVIGTGTGFPVGNSYRVTVDFYVSSSVQPGPYRLRVSNRDGSAYWPITIETLSRPPVISSLEPSIIYPDNTGPIRQMIVNGSNLSANIGDFSVSSPLIGLSMVFPNSISTVLALSNLQSAPTGSYALTARNAAGSATAYFDIVRFFF